MMPVAEMIESLYSQGVIEQDLGEFGSARTHFEKFLRVSPVELSRTFEIQFLFPDALRCLSNSPVAPMLRFVNSLVLSILTSFSAA